MFKKAILGVVMLLGAAAAVSAQAPQPHSESDQARARQKIFMMEGVLQRAVVLGIDSFRRQLSAVMPDDMLLVTGDAPQARGFRLDGYGVFFDVSVPGVRPSLAWSLRTMNETAAMFARDLQQMRMLVAQSVPDPARRQQLEAQLARIQAQVAPGQQAPQGQPASGRTASAALAAQTMAAPAPASEGAPAAPAAPPANVDPGEVFTQAVANSLIDAMLENSGSLMIAPDEWLTVAARDNAESSRFVASDPSDVMTIVLRVKGSDLAEFQARRLTPEEVRKRVEVRAF
ncbi:MAG TPA: hypothetical protein VM819_17365 [Vicinamibacterales bacterium]|nr:hypothetical protein [Vicinamibacterales bacterium]